MPPCSIRHIGGWDVDKVTNMRFMFSGATEFNQNIGGWDVDKVTDMRFMFDFAPAFNQNISGWDVDKVTDMSSMFSGAIEFNQNIGGWEVGEVTDISSMFESASAFNRFIGSWDVSTVTNMSFMFSGASRFNQNIGGWKVGEVTDMSFMFFGATVFDQDISDWDVSKVDNMEGMFEDATNDANYDALLVGWSMLTLRPGIDFHAGNSTYCNQPAHNVLTEPPNEWQITDRGPNAFGDCPLGFYVNIPDQNYKVGETVSVIMPEAFYGSGDLSYTLDGPIPVGLSFTTTNRTLTGMPRTTATAVTLNYIVEDNAPTPTSTTLTFMVTVDKGEQTSFVFADTTVRKNDWRRSLYRDRH